MSARPALLRRLAHSRSGVAMTEFALSMPLLLTAGLWGIEIAHLSIVNMRVSQVAMHIADNASRIGDTSTLEERRIYESDINDLLLGSNLQAGEALAFYEHGRTIISSLEVVEGTDDQQYIHWQRCKGKKRWDSSYGEEGEELDGMGPQGYEVMANPGGAVIFVEVSYEYQPLVSARFVGDTNITATSAFTVRDSRDLSEIYQRDPGQPDEIADCRRYDGFD